MKHVFIFHYHIKRGGVTSVIKEIIEALIKNKDHIQVHLVTSAVAYSCDHPLKDLLSRIKLHLNPLIAYVPAAVSRKKAYLTRCSSEIYLSLSRLIESLPISDCVFWAHNYHLGKNPAFTDALLKFIAGKRIKTLLHVHDFPEAGRLESYKSLKKYCPMPLYPFYPTITYIVINKQDRERLLQAGLPAEAVVYLPNFVSCPPKTSFTDRGTEMSTLIKLAEDLNIAFDPKLPLLLYPVRAIRRKNVLEAYFIQKLMDYSFNLFITLPGESRKEKPYSDRIISLIRKGVIKTKGSLGICALYPNIFPYLIKLSSCFISTSVLEGFGLTFIESALYKKPCIARSLQNITEFDSAKHIFFYPSLDVPLGKSEREYLKKKYQAKITFLPVKEEYKDTLLNQIYKLLERDVVDFSFLDFKGQVGWLTENNSSLLHLVRDKNLNMLEGINSLLSNDRSSVLNYNLQKEFSEQVFNKTVASLINSGCHLQEDVSRAEIEKKVLESFLHISYYRIIMD